MTISKKDSSIFLKLQQEIKNARLVNVPDDMWIPGYGLWSEMKQEDRDAFIDEWEKRNDQTY